MNGLPKTNTGAAMGGAAAFVFTMVATTFEQELGAGHIPIPMEWRWTIPLGAALIAALIAVVTPYAKKGE